MTEPDLSWVTPEIEEAQAHHAERVDALYAGRQPADVIAMAGPIFGSSHGLAGTHEIDMLEDPEAWLSDVLGPMAKFGPGYANRVTFMPLAIEIDPLGVHFIDALFGARTYFHSGQVWNDELECEVHELEEPDLESSELLAKSLGLARFVVEATQGRILITTPVLSCAINVSVNLFGDRILAALAAEPDGAARALRIVNNVLVDVTKAFHAAIPERVRRNSVACARYAPPGFGQIDGCATQLVSGAHYGRFFAELDEELLSVAPYGGMIHLCGAHEQHIAAFRGMSALRSVQTNDRATDSLSEFARGLRDDQVLYVAPTVNTPIEKVMEIAGGRPLVLEACIEEPIPVRR